MLFCFNNFKKFLDYFEHFYKQWKFKQLAVNTKIKGTMLIRLLKILGHNFLFINSLHTLCLSTCRCTITLQSNFTYPIKNLFGFLVTIKCFDNFYSSFFTVVYEIPGIREIINNKSTYPVSHLQI